MRRPLMIAAAVALAVPLLAACGSSGGTEAGSSATPTTNATGAPTTAPNASVAPTTAPAAPAASPTSTASGKAANCPATGGVPAFKGTWGVAPTIPKPTGPVPKTLKKPDCLVGTGAAVTDTTKPYNWNYTGVFYKNGEVFDSSFTRGAPITFSLNQVIPGWTEGLIGMKVGGRRLLVLPSDKAYGPGGSPPVIGPNEPLIFVVDLVGPAPAG